MATESELEIPIGFSTVFSKCISETDIQLFAQATGDFNPLHLNDAYAQKTRFKGRIAHGILTVGLISAALSRLPGVVVYVSQNISFLKPVRIGQTIQATVTVVDRIAERSEYTLRTTCTNPRGEIVVDGEARVRIMKMEENP